MAYLRPIPMHISNETTRFPESDSSRTFGLSISGHLPFGENVPKATYNALSDFLDIPQNPAIVKKSRSFFGEDADSLVLDHTQKRIKLTDNNSILPIHGKDSGMKYSQYSKDKSVDWVYFNTMHQIHLKEENVHLNKQPLFSPDNQTIQLDITSDVRCILLNWLYEVVDVHKISTHTFFLTIHYLDNLIRLIPIKKHHFQLWGCVCLFLAAKMEEMKVPEIATLIYMAGSCFTTANVQYCEQVLLMLTWQRDINLTTRFSFCEYYGCLVNMTRKETCFYQYLLELSLFDVSLCHEPASKIAAAGLHLALQSTRDYHMDMPSCELWDDYLIHHTGYREADLVTCIQRIHQQHWNTDISSTASIAKSCENLMKKYNQKIYYYASSNILAVTYDRLWLGWEDYHERARNRDQHRMRLLSIDNQDGVLDSTFISPTASVEENSQDGHHTVGSGPGDAPSDHPVVTPRNTSSSSQAKMRTTRRYGRYGVNIVSQ